MLSCSVISSSLQPRGFYSPPVSSVLGIFQARILEPVAICYPGGSSQPTDQTHASCISCTGQRLFPLCRLGNPLGAYWWLFLALLQKFPANYFKGSFLLQFKMAISDLQTCIHSPKVLTRNLCVRNQSCVSVWSLYPSKAIVHAAELNPL